MSNLLVHTGQPDESGNVIKITPQSAGFSYVGFEVYALSAGERLSRETETREICLVLLSGYADVKTRDQAWQRIGSRMSVFEKTRPYAVYIPSGESYSLEALSDVEVAVCTAPGKGSYEARLIKPEEMSVEDRGKGNNTRRVHNILPEQQPADSLLVVEVFTPEANWSSYPPHKHDNDNLPVESCLEETYYYKVNPPQGFGVQRLYTDDRYLDETMTVHDGDVVLVHRGYHPVGVPPGYELYYLNVMAGPVRTWKLYNDPAHEWILSR